MFLLFLAVYVRTAAPSVLSGDSAEFQLAAPLLGVPHPTTYPLYVLLGKLATLLIPVGDLAWRVTLVSALCAALAVALFFLLARRFAGLPGAIVAALALGVTPGLWNAATLAEVYALLAALLAGLGYLLATTDDRQPTTDDRPTTTIAEPRTENREPPRGYPTENKEQRTENKIVQHASRVTHHASRVTHHASRLTRSPVHPFTRSRIWRLRGAAFVAGLGCTHHGLFVLTGLPLFVGYALWWLVGRTTDDRRPTTNAHSGTENREPPRGYPTKNRNPEPRTPNPELRTTDYGLQTTLAELLVLALYFAAGLAPWLYPLIQYARYGPFDGQDYGLPHHYFWGAPQSWDAVLDLLSGGSLRRGIFRLPQASAALATLRLVGERMMFEFGPLGVALGLLGCGALVRRSRAAWLGAAWVFLVTLSYLLLLGPAVADAPIFTLPMLLPWALWIAAAVQFLLQIADCRLQIVDYVSRAAHQVSRFPTRRSSLVTRHASRIVSLPVHPFTRSPAQAILLMVLIVATLAWGYTRIQHSSKRRLWLFREFGQTTLANLPPGAVVIAHWEQGMTLQYLRLVEGQRPDVWIDVLEPADEAWGARAARRYAGRPVFFAGQPVDVAGLPVELAREGEYANLFRLLENRRSLEKEP
jgi:hypothetical protein